jgi:hypothetical protein
MAGKHQWVQLGGREIENTTKNNGASYGANGRVWFKPAKGGKYFKDSGALHQMTSDQANHMYGVNTLFNIYYKLNMKSHWVQIPGQLQHISACGNGKLWGCAPRTHGLYTMDSYKAKNWTNVTKGGLTKCKTISCSNDNKTLLAVDLKNKVWMSKNSAKSWISMNKSAGMVNIFNDNKVLLTQTQKNPKQMYVGKIKNNKFAA